MRLFLRTSVFLVFSCVLLVTAPAAHAVDITNYLFPTTATGTSISSGEFFQVINESNGCYKVKKSQDDRFYERFCLVGDKIHHVIDTTWATDSGDVRCTNGNTASFGYSNEDQGAVWVNRNMNVGDCTKSEGTIVGIDEVKGGQCQAPHTGRFDNRQICLTHQGCIKFPNGTASANGIVLEVESGPGVGEQFFYDANRGWVGFNRGENTGDSGAYTTEDLSGGAALTGCREVIIKAAKCPRGYNCPDTSFKSVPGKEIPVEKKGFFGLDLPSFFGQTGPSQKQLRSPDLSQEESLFMDSEVISRSLPYEAVQAGFPKFEAANLQGALLHPGCGKVSVDGKIVGDTKIRQDEAKLFPLSSSFNNLLLGFRFWESQSVGDKPSSLKFRSIQPDGKPATQENTGDCVNEGGETYGEAITLENPPPPSAGLLQDLVSGISGFFSGLLTRVGATATATFSLQQLKFFPGEQDLAKTSNNFLNNFLPYEETLTTVDQEETNSYYAVGEGITAGVPFEGAKSTQDKSLNLVKSLRPYEETIGVTTLGSTFGLATVEAPEAGLNYKVAYNDPRAVTLTPETKTTVVDRVKNAWPNTKMGELWDTVVADSIKANINPAFAIAIWIGESGGSHYNNHFSCPPSESDFRKSFDCFLNTTNNIQPPSWTRWVRNYCGTPEDQAICTNDDNNYFIDNFKSWYDIIVPPGSPGSAQPF